jgi:anaerobic selenocysteine-containing dehydrogenase
VLTDIAEKMGCKEAFTEGHDEMEWLEIIYNSMIEDGSPLPPFAEAWKSHIVKKADPDGHSVAFKDFREDPIANPLKTPSGKIEIYSEELAEIAGTWELDEADIIDPLPVYAPENGGYLNASEATPLQMTGYHFKGRTHSCYAPIDVLQQANRQQVWINPADAESRGIQTGDRVKITNAQGTTHMEARVTPRVMPGVVAAGQGAWYKGGADGTDEGGCINTLVSGHPSPLAKANPSHTILVEIAKA